MTMAEAIEHSWFYHDDFECEGCSEDDTSSIETVL